MITKERKEQIVLIIGEKGDGSCGFYDLQRDLFQEGYYEAKKEAKGQVVLRAVKLHYLRIARTLIPDLKRRVEAEALGLDISFNELWEFYESIAHDFNGKFGA